MSVEAGHWGVRPSTVADAIVDAMAVLKYVEASGSGCLRQIARIEGTAEGVTVEQIRRAAVAGTPAIFVYCAGTKYDPDSTDGRHFRGEMTFQVLACADSWLTKIRRLGGDASIDYSAISHPKEVGVEELSEWGAYLGLRAVIEIDGISRAKLVESIPGEQIDKGLYVGSTVMVASRAVDVYDDAPTATFESIGLVHDPKDENNLWTDPPTDSDPDTDDWGDEVDGGHYQLEDV
jgi:hypothetical protein